MGKRPGLDLAGLKSRQVTENSKRKGYRQNNNIQNLKTNTIHVSKIPKLKSRLFQRRINLSSSAKIGGKGQVSVEEKDVLIQEVETQR